MPQEVSQTQYHRHDMVTKMKRRFAVSCQVPSVTANLDGQGSALAELHGSPAAMAPKKGPSPKVRLAAAWYDH